MKPDPKPQASRAARGFTLTELLVTIVVIAVLAALIIPIARTIRSKAADSQCAGHLRAWGNAFALYAADNNGTIECRDWNSIGREQPSAYVNYLAGEESHEAGYRELGKIRCCPALRGADAVSGNGNSLTAYAMTDASGVASGNQKNASYSLASIRNPQRFVMMIEATNVRTPAIVRSTSDYTSMVMPLTRKPQIRHGKGLVNALMGDYSIRSFDAGDVSRNMTQWTTF